MSTAQVRADSILFKSATRTPVGGGVTEWNYTVELTTLSNIVVGDFFVIQDFSGLVGTTPPNLVAPAGWSASVENSTLPYATSTGTVTPAGDDPLIPNLRFTATAAAGPGTLDISGFIARTFNTPITSENIYSRDHNSDLTRTQGNTGSIDVPAVPLPATANMGLVLLGSVGGLGALRRLKNAKNVEA